MRKFQLLITGLLLTGLLPGRLILAQSLDPAFIPSSIFAPGTVYSAVEQSDGKRLVAGQFSRINGTATSGITRFDASGALDASFQQNVGTANGVYRPRLLPNGQIMLIALSSSLTAGGLTRQSVLRLNANGTADATFNPGTGATANGNGIFVDDQLPLPNGQTVVVGPFDRFNGTAAKGIVRLTPTGAVDPTFASGTGASSEVEIIIGLPNGQLLIGGFFSSYNGNPCNGLARLNADGSFDPTFAAPFDTFSEAINLVLQPDGKILVAGGIYIANGNRDEGLVRLLPNGTLDPTFASPATAGAYSVYSYFGDAVQVQADGKILVVDADGVSGSSGPSVERLDPNGNTDATYQPAISAGSVPFSLTLLANGSSLVGGPLTNVNGLLNRPLVQLTSTGALNLAFQPVIQTTGTVQAVVRQPDGKLIAGGNFSEINGQPANSLVRFNATGGLETVFNTPTTTRFTVSDLALQPDGRVLAATGSTVLRFLSTGGVDNGFAFPANYRATRIVLQTDGRVVAAFGSVPSSAGNLVRVLADGARDATFTPVTNGPGGLRTAQSLALQPNGKILVAGNFIPVGGTASISTVVRLETTGALDASFSSSSFAGVTSSTGLSSLALQPDGKVVVGGQFTAYGGTARTNLARLNADGSLDPGFVPPALTGTVLKVLLQPNNRILVGGSFSATGLPANLGRLLPTGQPDASFGATAQPNETVYALLAQPDGLLVAGGTFTTIGGQASPALARIVASNVLSVKAPQAVADRTLVWPVPAYTSLHVAPDASAMPQALDLFDAMGRAVRHLALTGASPVTLPVEILPAGIYMLRVTYAEGTVLRRVQLQ